MRIIRSELSLPEIGLIAMTRGMLGAGIGLLLADRLDAKPRRAVGCTLVAVGLLTTLPLFADVLARRVERRDGAPAARTQE